jgi:hypothetical protein
MRKTKIVLLLFVALLLSKCDSGSYESIPYVSEYMTLGLNTDLAKWSQGGLAVIQHNSSNQTILSYPPKTTTTRLTQTLYGNGIIFYWLPISGEKKAYMLTCTYNPKEYNKLSYNVSSGCFVCSKCGSKFLPEDDGIYPISGNAIRPLQEYPITDTGSSIVLIY